MCCQPARVDHHIGAVDITCSVHHAERLPGCPRGECAIVAVHSGVAIRLSDTTAAFCHRKPRAFGIPFSYPLRLSFRFAQSHAEAQAGVRSCEYCKIHSDTPTPSSSSVGPAVSIRYLSLEMAHNAPLASSAALRPPASWPPDATDLFWHSRTVAYVSADGPCGNGGFLSTASLRPTASCGAARDLPSAICTARVHALPWPRQH